MPIVQMTPKLRRNAPCPCGSGRKYKKCCGKKEGEKIMTEEQMLKDSRKILKNEFRDEVRDPYAGIPERVLVTRDQAVLLKELRFREGVRKANIEGIGKVIEDAKVLLVELLALPKSPYREICIADVKHTTENNKKQLEVQVEPRNITLTLLALEELFAEPTEDEDEVKPIPVIRTQQMVEVEYAEDDDELTIPDDQPGDGVDSEDKPEQAI